MDHRAGRVRQEFWTPAGALLIDTDVACRVRVDGEDVGEVEPGIPKRVAVGIGTQLVTAVSNEGGVTWKGSPEVKIAAQRLVTIELKAIASRAADLEKLRPFIGLWVGATEGKDTTDSGPQCWTESRVDRRLVFTDDGLTGSSLAGRQVSDRRETFHGLCQNKEVSSPNCRDDNFGIGVCRCTPTFPASLHADPASGVMRLELGARVSCEGGCGSVVCGNGGSAESFVVESLSTDK